MKERETEGDRARHPVGVVTQRTGLTAHTLRAWERRYRVVEPQRTDGGHRLYSDADVEHLQLLRELTLTGRQIGQIADLPVAELQRLLREDREAAARAPRGDPDRGPDQEMETILEQSFAAVEAMDPDRLDAVLRRGALLRSTVVFLDDLLVPLMHRIGAAWEHQDLHPAQEHLASVVAFRVAGWLLDAFHASEGAPVLVVATPSGARHELGALWVAVTAASGGWQIRHLGSDLPARDIGLAARRSDARAVALSLVYPPGDRTVEEELRLLRRELDATAILVGGRAAGSYESVLQEIGAVHLPDFQALAVALRQLHLRSA